MLPRTSSRTFAPLSHYPCNNHTGSFILRKTLNTSPILRTTPQFAPRLICLQNNAHVYRKSRCRHASTTSAATLQYQARIAALTEENERLAARNAELEQSARQSSKGSAQDGDGPLSGLRVVEVGNFIAGPFAGTLLGYFGAEVIKIEPPGGDQVRKFRDVDANGDSWWWHSIARNKRSVEMDLKKPGAQRLARELCNGADAVIENFRPGNMEKWGLGPDDLKKTNPNLIYTRVSGYGQTGPYRGRPGFASACEAMGGFRYVNGFEDRPSVRPNLSIGDTLAGTNAALGTVLALLARERGLAEGQVVDSAIYESVFQLMEGVLCDYDGAGIIREPSGSTVTGIVPSNTYGPTTDGKQVVIGGNSDTLFKRLMKVVDQPGMAEDEAYNNNQKRVEHQELIDRLINDWVKMNTADTVLDKLNEAVVPNGLIYSIVDIVKDPQYIARGMVEEVNVPSLSRTLKIPGIGPKLSITDGKTRFAGPQLGADSSFVLREVLNLSEEKIGELVSEGSLPEYTLN